MESSAQPIPQPQKQRGFLEALMDTRFDSLITPMLIRFLYVVSMILLTIGVIVVVIASFADKPGNGVLALILAPLGALIYLIVIRLWLELIVVTFKIREAAEQVADNTRQPGA
jgi:uncharacterized protein DUF4282